MASGVCRATIKPWLPTQQSRLFWAAAPCLAIGKPDQNPTVKPRMPRTMQFFENTYPADADGVLDQLPAFDEEVHRYYDLRQADRPVDAFSDQVATISQQDVSHQTLLDKAAAQGFRLDQ